MKEDVLGKIFSKCLKVLHIKLDEKKEKLLLQMFKFAIVGGTAFLIDYIILIICKEVFHLDTLLSAAIGFTISTIVNYILSVTWVFDVSGKHSGKRNFIIFVIFSIFINIFEKLLKLMLWFILWISMFFRFLFFLFDSSNVVYGLYSLCYYIKGK